MIVVVMLMHLSAFFHAVHGYGHMCPDDTAFFSFFPPEFHSGNTKRIQFLRKGVRVRQEFKQRCCQHIAGSTHSAVQIQCLHFLASIWLIMFARYPAPKPLSMFTTDTPLAQELSMDRSADTPPKEAP